MYTGLEALCRKSGHPPTRWVTQSVTESGFRAALEDVLILKDAHNLWIKFSLVFSPRNLSRHVTVFSPIFCLRGNEWWAELKSCYIPGRMRKRGGKRGGGWGQCKKFLPFVRSFNSLESWGRRDMQQQPEREGESYNVRRRNVISFTIFKYEI